LDSSPEILAVLADSGLTVTPTRSEDHLGKIREKALNLWETDDVCYWLEKLDFDAEDVACIRKANVTGLDIIKGIDKKMVRTNLLRLFSLTF
tara:strand:- start:596 stop:871 length:276 start_codon:yes stop_codon:yes gene_type:complete